MPSRLRTSLESRGGGGGVASALKWGTPRTILVPSVKPWFLVNEYIPAAQWGEGGLNVGDYWPFHEGGYRICQAKEDLVPGRATFWAGSEEGRVSSTSSPTILAVDQGDKDIFVETTASFEADEFSGGLFRVTGGLSTVAGRYYTISSNEASYESAEISGDANRYVTKIVLQDHIDTDLDQDTDWHIQGSVFACQRHAPGDAASGDDTDQPRLSIGIPRIPIPTDSYFWCQVSGSAQGQLRDAISATDVVSGGVDLMPWPGTASDSAADKADVGKLVTVDSVSDDLVSQVFARLVVRQETAFADDAYVPIWLYGGMAV